MYYNITLGNETEDYIFSYNLEDHRPAQIWAKLISDLSTNELRKSLNPRRGDSYSWNDKIIRLNNLIELLNSWLPESIHGTWDDNNPTESLNRLHVHFPEYERKENNIERRQQLSEYNDLIHEIEFMYHSKLDKKNRVYFLCCFENKTAEELKEEDYKYFQIQRKFGDLLLHYPHVGRHPLELAVQKDISCPKDQIVCQYQISADHSLRFSDFNAGFDQFEEFYYSSNINWPYALNDPRLAVGYIKLGTLEKVNDKVVDRERIQEIITKVDTIKHWDISL